MRRHFRTHGGPLDSDELDGDGAPGGGGPRSENAHPPELDEDMRRLRPRARSGAETSAERGVVSERGYPDSLVLGVAAVVPPPHVRDPSLVDMHLQTPRRTCIIQHPPHYEQKSHEGGLDARSVAAASFLDGTTACNLTRNATRFRRSHSDRAPTPVPPRSLSLRSLFCVDPHTASRFIPTTARWSPGLTARYPAKIGLSCFAASHLFSATVVGRDIMRVQGRAWASVRGARRSRIPVQALSVRSSLSCITRHMLAFFTNRRRSFLTSSRIQRL
jgi:hypothetical protein